MGDSIRALDSFFCQFYLPPLCTTSIGIRQVSKCTGAPCTPQSSLLPQQALVGDTAVPPLLFPQTCRMTRGKYCRRSSLTSSSTSSSATPSCTTTRDTTTSWSPSSWWWGTGWPRHWWRSSRRIISGTQWEERSQLRVLRLWGYHRWSWLGRGAGKAEPRVKAAACHACTQKGAVRAAGPHDSTWLCRELCPGEGIIDGRQLICSISWSWKSQRTCIIHGCVAVRASPVLGAGSAPASHLSLHSPGHCGRVLPVSCTSHEVSPVCALK